ncbi:MAG TPA: hypothetical protein VFV34_13815 [Blastocatellia bacterium]|nr:hypothetical protein [Blastocatellia bacterium]
MILITLALIAGFLTTSAFFYGGRLVLHWLEIPDSPQAIARLASPTGSELLPASALEGEKGHGPL